MEENHLMDFSKYPRTKVMLTKTGWTLEKLYEWIEQECERRGIL